MDESLTAIRRNMFPEDLTPLAEACNVEGTIAVQAAPTVPETKFLLRLAEQDPSIKGVVGWVDLASSKAVNQLQDLVSNPLFKGVRPMLQEIEEDDWILNPQVLSNLAIVGKMGLSLDAHAQPRHFFALETIASNLPNLPMVIDHCAKPSIRGGVDAGANWRESMAMLSRHDQVYCKFSGLTNEYGEGWTVEALRPLFDHILECFGPERIMWGSHWPILELTATYQNWFCCARQLTSALSEEDRDWIFGGTASKFYRLAPDVCSRAKP